MEDAPLSDQFAEWQGLAPVAVRWHVARAFTLVLVPFALGGVVALTRDLDPVVLRLGVLGLAALAVLNGVRTIVWARRFRFRLTATTVETRSRVLSETTRLVPLGRIQHVDVSAGPIERMLRVANVAAHTAAGDSTIVIAGVVEPVAASLRDRLLRERKREAV
jgi:membrane protein YdbS with pleckstrin-like domain